MNLLTKSLLPGVLLMFAGWAGATTAGSERCDHQEPKTFLVEVILDKKNPKAMPAVKPNTIVVCSQDTIEFERQAGSARQEFYIEFEEKNPYLDNLKSDSRGVAKGKVKIDPATDPKNPTKGPVFLKYWVKAPGRKDLDPRIIITPH